MGTGESRFCEGPALERGQFHAAHEEDVLGITLLLRSIELRREREAGSGAALGESGVEGLAEKNWTTRLAAAEVRCAIGYDAFNDSAVHEQE